MGGGGNNLDFWGRLFAGVSLRVGGILVAVLIAGVILGRCTS